MAKYEVKDINKNGVKDDWEIAKYAKANAAAEESPTKMIGGVAGAMAQQTGAIDQTTGMSTQLNQLTPNPYPNQNALGPAQASTIPGMMGQNIPGTVNNVMPQTGARGPLGMHTPEHKKNEVNLSASQNTQKSETDANKTTSSLRGGVDYKRGNLGLNASGDSNKNYKFGLQLSNKKGNVSGGVNYDTGQFGNTVSGNIKLRF